MLHTRTHRSWTAWALAWLLAGAGGCPEWDLQPACAPAPAPEDAADGDAEAVPTHEQLPFYEKLFVGGQQGPFAMRGFDYRGVGPGVSDGVVFLVPTMERYAPASKPAPTPRTRRESGSPRPPDRWDVYSEIAFEDAMQVAGQQDLWLLVRFGTGWSEPTRWLDEALNAPQVVDWLEAHAVTIAVDAEAQPELAREQEVFHVPTLVLYRHGVEWAGRAGFQANMDMLTWLVQATDGPADPRERFDGSAAEPSKEARKAERDSDPVWQAHARAYHARRERRYDDALQDMLWLWREGGLVTPSYRGVRVSFGAMDMERLAKVHPPALEAFDALRVEARDAVLAGGADKDAVRDWFVLTDVVSKEHGILAWFDSVSDATGQLPPEFANVTPYLIDLLLEHDRRGAAGRLMDDVDERVRVKFLGWPQAFRPQSPMHVLCTGELLELVRIVRESIRTDLAALHATLLAAGRYVDAERVAQALLHELDDVATRAALIEAALEVHVLLPSHEVWLEQAEELELLSPGAEGVRTSPIDGASDPHADLELLRRRVAVARAANVVAPGAR